MKLRLQSNSVRLRLKRAEVAQLVKTGRVEEVITMGGSRDDVFRYILEASNTVSTPRATLKNREVLVQVSAREVARWESGDEVGMEATQLVGDGVELQVLIEKDFACLNGTNEQNVDTFANPLAETKC
jgi:hypothetical protein